MKPIYLDYNATTPIDPRVAEKMLPFLHQHFGNPSSSHVYGVTTKKAVEKARRQIAELFHCEMDEIIFTSGGSESNNYAIKGIASSLRSKGNHIITSAIEHPAVIEVCRFLEEKGYTVTYLPVDKFGLVEPKQVEEAITPQTTLISIMHSNNEIGTIEPIVEITEVAHQHNILMHTDCAQSIGKIPVQIDELGVDLLSVTGHKLYAPKGIGALYIRSGLKLEKMVHGANHEMNLRAGTENVLEIVGLGEACEMVSENLQQYQSHMKKMRDHFEKSLTDKLGSIHINGHLEKRLPNTSSISFKGLEANTIISEMENVAASAGAACHSDKIEISSVLDAMKVPLEQAMGTIRFSVGRYTKKDEIEKAVEEISIVAEKLQPKGTTQIEDVYTKKVKLTQYTHGLGCACKLRPQLLEDVLRRLPIPTDENILVGTDTADDAAIYKIDDQTAIIQTVDFFTPIVDDPYQFGAIAATNSLSDIYAMGGKPLFALNVVGFPSNRLPMNVLEQILKGAQDKSREAGISIVGGHTVDDTEPKFGLAVTGIIHPEKILTNKNARPGDVLILTKPIGTGIYSTALKRGLLDQAQEKLLTETMAFLNKIAAEVMQKVGVNSCTDITGFGLLGHLLEMMNCSTTAAEVEFNKIHFLPDLHELALSGVIPGGTNDNFAYTQPFVNYADKLSETKRLLLNDAQTSGGLLISVEEKKSELLLKTLEGKNVQAFEIGKVIQRNEIRINVIL